MEKRSPFSRHYSCLTASFSYYVNRKSHLADSLSVKRFERKVKRPHTPQMPAKCLYIGISGQSVKRDGIFSFRNNMKKTVVYGFYETRWYHLCQSATLYSNGMAGRPFLL